ncbi:hypothetical protein OF83DRAFT_1177744 [Amylostereum chailletii]|nr:hypothetical protein OF83DRAFT_1177744 [Amylostereum chailletii]
MDQKTPAELELEHKVAELEETISTLERTIHDLGYTVEFRDRDIKNLQQRLQHSMEVERAAYRTRDDVHVQLAQKDKALAKAVDNLTKARAAVQHARDDEYGVRKRLDAERKKREEEHKGREDEREAHEADLTTLEAQLEHTKAKLERIKAKAASTQAEVRAHLEQRGAVRASVLAVQTALKALVPACSLAMERCEEALLLLRDSSPEHAPAPVKEEPEGSPFVAGHSSSGKRPRSPSDNEDDIDPADHRLACKQEFMLERDSAELEYAA